MPSRTSKGRPKTIDLNLIPLELRRPFFTRNTLLLMGGIVLVVALFFFIDSVRAGAEWQIYDLEGESITIKSALQKENSRISAEQAEAGKVEQEINRLKEDIARFKEKPQLRTRRLISLGPAVEAALANQPAGAQVTTLSWLEPRLVVQGKAPNTQLILSYAERLKTSGRFSQVELRLVTAATSPNPAAAPGGEFSFTLELDVPAARGAG